MKRATPCADDVDEMRAIQTNERQTMKSVPPGFENLVTGVASILPGDLKRHPVTDPVAIPKQIQPTATQTIRIDGWMPTPLNKYTDRHWAVRKRAKDADASEVALACRFHGTTVAAVKRRVRVLIVLPKGQRACDPDAVQKSLGDALVKCGALKNDSRIWVEWAPVEFTRGERLTTFLTLEDMS